MRLKNKKTGEVVEANKIGLVWNRLGMPADIGNYGSLAELNACWEDYEPEEPLIKDEKIRKAVKVWAEANHAKCARIVGVGTLRCERTGVDIEFDGAPFVGWVTELKTIAELCGEDGDEA